MKTDMAHRKPTEGFWVGETMSKRQRPCQPLGILLVLLFLCFGSACAQGINSCKYMLVNDFTTDPYGIAEELRAQATAKGFVVISAVANLSPADSLKACVMEGSWSREAFGGRISMRVLDASGALIDEVSVGGGGMGVDRTRRSLVGKIYSHLRYTGYSEIAYLDRIQREYPARPKLVITEAQIRKNEVKNRVEGIWTDTEGKYRLGIVAAPEGGGADYLAVVLQSNSPIWQIGEIKGEIRSTASPDVFTCTYFMGNKKPAGTTLTLDRDSSLRGSVNTPKGKYDLTLLRVWPKMAEGSSATPSEKSVFFGTAFLLSRTGLVATNWHVVSEGKSFSVAFPGWAGEVSADIVIKDVVNDLAILRVADPTKLETTCPELPFQLVSSKGVKLGERVTTVGYPLTSVLGSNPKFSEGVVSSKSGLRDDPRSLQISAQVQPGSSGSPLFDSDGNVVGIVVATLDAAKVYQLSSAIPQNVNYAIKADYLLSLVAMLPGNPLASRTTVFSPEKAAQCIAIIRAW